MAVGGPSEPVATCRKLRRVFPTSRLGNPEQPLDDLVYLVLSNRSSARLTSLVYFELKSRSESWHWLATSDVVELEGMLRPLGLAKKKSAQLTSLVRQIEADFGRTSLADLANWSTPDAERYLESLPGVSTKVAKCVLLFTLSRAVVPVDVHVHRIAMRLGWTTKKRADQSHDDIERHIPLDLRRSFHVNAIQLGRSSCRSKPRCSTCPLQDTCPSRREAA